MKIPNIKSLKDADRFCKKQLRDMKVFATNKGEKYIEKKISFNICCFFVFYRRFNGLRSV